VGLSLVPLPGFSSALPLSSEVVTGTERWPCRASPLSSLGRRPKTWFAAATSSPNGDQVQNQGKRCLRPRIPDPSPRSPRPSKARCTAVSRPVRRPLRSTTYSSSPCLVPRRPRFAARSRTRRQTTETSHRIIARQNRSMQR